MSLKISRIGVLNGRLAIVLACILATGSVRAEPEPTDQPAREVFSKVESILDELREIMGFGPRRPVSLKTISKPAFRKLYQEQMRKENNPRQMRREVLFLRLFGLVPADFDYEETVLDLLSEQAWALYDFKRRNLYLADWAPRDALEYALVHELVHAVDDQNFNLLKYMQSTREAESQVARLAAVEGQASWVMTEWAMRQSGKSLEGNRILAIATASATRFEAQQFPVYDSTPTYFREVLIFPYTDGLLFQHDMVERFGQDGFKRVFQAPPATTQQILQPELYLTGTVPEPPALPRISVPKGYKRVFDGTFGQLDHKILIQHHLGSEDFGELLDKWRGSQFEILERARTGDAILRYAVRWEYVEVASEYYHLYRQICEKKRAGLKLLDSGESRCEGVVGQHRVVLEQVGTVVQGVEGLPAS